MVVLLWRLTLRCEVCTLVCTWCPALPRDTRETLGERWRGGGGGRGDAGGTPRRRWEVNPSLSDLLPSQSPLSTGGRINTRSTYYTVQEWGEGVGGGVRTYAICVLVVAARGFEPVAPSSYKLVLTSHGTGLSQSEERPAGAGACVDRLLTFLSDIPA